MNLRPFALIAALAVISLPALDALAGEKDKTTEVESKYPEIKPTAVEDFNPAFLKGKAIHATLQATEDQLVKLNKSTATSLQLDETTSLDKSLAQLKSRANKKLTATLERGRVPQVKAEDALVPEVQQALDTLNVSLNDLDRSLQQVEQLAPEVQALLTEVAGFPGLMGPDIFKKNKVAAADIPKVTKQINSNMKAVNATPERVKAVTDQSLNVFSQVSAAFQ